MGRILKFLVAAAIFAILSTRVDFSAAFAAAAHANLAQLGLALIATLAITFADAAFWTACMRAAGCRMAFKSALAFSFVSAFFSNLAPSTVGGDLFRAAQMRHGGASTETSLRLVVAARLMSFASLIVLLFAAAPFTLGLLEGAEKRIVIFAGGVGAFGLGAFMLFWPRLAQTTFLSRIPLAQRVNDLAKNLRQVLFTGASAPAAWAFLTAQHLLRVVAVAAIAAALHVEVAFADLIGLIPAALLVAMIPISLGSWGVRELSFIYFLGLAGVSASDALAISVLYGLARIVIGVIGGFVFIGARKKHYAFAIEEAAETPSR